MYLQLFHEEFVLVFLWFWYPLDCHENKVFQALSSWFNVSNIVERGFNWDSLHVRLNIHYEARSYKEKKHKKVKAYRESD